MYLPTTASSHGLQVKRGLIVSKFVTTITVLAVGLGVAACANMPSAVTQQNAPATANSPSPQQSALTYYNGTISPFEGAASNPDVPGATGRTIVPGDNSTIDGDSMATQMERTGALGGGD
jgi:hypothetical protein